MSTEQFAVPLYLPPILRTPHFTGRESLLLKLHNALASNIETNSQRVIVLFGPGGIGKTQIAIEYIHRHKKQYRPIIWIDGTSLESTRSSFFHFANHLTSHLELYQMDKTKLYERLKKHVLHDRTSERDFSKFGVFRKKFLDAFLDPGGRPNGESKCLDVPLRDSWSQASEIIIPWLNHPHNNDWLLVFDNVDEIDSFDIRDFFPDTSKGYILITSRKREAARFGKGILVSELNESDAVKLLLNSADLDLDLNPEGSVSLRKMFIDRRLLEFAHAL